MLEGWLIYKRLAPFIGLAVIPLLILLLIQKGETHHWKKQSGQFEQLYHGEQAAFTVTVANYRRAAEQALAADKANAERVAGEQAAINERIAHDYETRIAAARTAAERLRAGTAAAHPGGRPGAPVPGLSAATGGAAQAAGEGRLPAPLSGPDALTATEQAIQLDELIKWVEGQHEVDTNDPQPRR
jgi:hypothetical protein